MAEVYVGQIMMTGFGFASRGFALSNGQLMSIQQNQALFSLIGTYYGGNGTQTFQLPNLMGRVPVGQGASVSSAWQPTPYTVGTSAGVESVVLTGAQMPQHTHIVNATTQAGSARIAGGQMLAASSQAGDFVFGVAPGTPTPLSPKTIGSAGNNIPHANMQPYTVISYQIALSGVFPSRN